MALCKMRVLAFSLTIWRGELTIASKASRQKIENGKPKTVHLRNAKNTSF